MVRIIPKIRSYFALSAIIVVAFSLTACGNGKKADDNLVNFKLVCTEQKPNCSKVINQSDGKEIFVENKSILNVADIDKASVIEQQETPISMGDFKNMLEDKKTSEDQPAKTYNSLLLRFKNKKAVFDITSKNIGRQMAIFVNGKLVMAPKIVEPIQNGLIMIMDRSSGGQNLHAIADQINDSN